MISLTFCELISLFHMEQKILDIALISMYNVRKGVDIMPVSEARKRANAKYSAKAYKQLMIRVKAGQDEIIKAYAENQGESLNGYINRLIAQDMGEALTKPTKQEQDD